MRALIVEDENTQALLLSEMLSQAQPPFDCSIARDLGAARIAAAQDRFDAVLLDLNLPDSQGLDTLSALRQVTNLPVVVFTGESGLGEDAIAHGADDYLVKGEAAPRAVARALAHAIVRRRLRSAERTISDQLVLLDSARDAIILCSADGAIRYWSAGAAQIYGWSAAEVEGRDVLELLSNASSTLDYVRSLTLERGEWRGEIRHVTRNQEELIVDSRWSVVERGEESSPLILILNTDITTQKRLEAQLFRSQRLETLGTLAGGIAHDLNNILMPIALSTSLLRRKVRDAELDPVLTRIDTSTRRAAELIGQLLTFAKGQPGNCSLVDPTGVIQEIELVARQTFPTDVHVVSAMSCPLWPVQCNPIQLHQVLLNLIVNARDAMPDGGTIVVGSENAEVDETFAAMSPDARPGSYVRFRVEDTGTGIPERIRAAIFDPFYTTKDAKGTGLGLTITRSIVQNHHGFITLESDVGRGTTFSVYIPAAPNANLELSERASAPVVEGRGELLLVIDDEESIREITRATLEANGYRVLVASDGAEGLSLFAREQSSIAVVILDVVMPVMDGAMTMRAIRWLSRDLPVIVMTGRGGPAGDDELLESATALLPKPFTADRLLIAVQTALGGTSAEAASQ